MAGSDQFCMSFFELEHVENMNHELLNYYYTDNQLATILGITLGGLRNKIYKETKNRKERDGGISSVNDGHFLPECLSVNARTRLWPKEKVKAFLLREYQGNEELVAKLVAKGEQASPSIN